MNKALLLLLTSLLLLGCGQKKVAIATPSSKPKPGGPVLARVGDETLTRDELMILFQGQVPPDVPRDKLQPVLERWANVELWYQEAVRQGIGQDETTQIEMSNREHSDIAQMMLNRILDTLTVPDADVYDYFNQHKDDYAVSTSITYLCVFDSSLAARVFDQVKSGTSFEAAAKQFSPDQATYGKPTPYFLRNDSLLPLLQVSRELNQTIFGLQKGELSGVVKVEVQGNNTFWIIQCLDRKRVKSDVNFNDVQQEIRGELLGARRQAVAANVSDELGQKTKIDIKTDNFYGSGQGTPAPVPAGK